MRWLPVLLLAASAHAQISDGKFEKGIRGWMLVNNSGSAAVEHDRKREALRFEKRRGGGMDVVRYDLDRIPAPGSEFVLKARFERSGSATGGSRSSSTTRTATISARAATSSRCAEPTSSRRSSST